MKKFYVLVLVLWFLTGCVSSYTPQNTQTTRQNLPPDAQRIVDCFNKGDSQACHQVFLDTKAICESSSSVIKDYNTYRHANTGGSCYLIAKIYGDQEGADKFGLNINTNSAEALKISFRYVVKACFLGDTEACLHSERAKINLEQHK